MASRPKEHPRPEIAVVECKGCGRCVAACPDQLLKMSEKVNKRGYLYAEYAGEGCKGCASCYYTCPEPGAIEIHLPPSLAKAKGEQ